MKINHLAYVFSIYFIYILHLIVRHFADYEYIGIHMQFYVGAIVSGFFFIYWFLDFWNVFWVIYCIYCHQY